MKLCRWKKRRNCDKPSKNKDKLLTLQIFIVWSRDEETKYAFSFSKDTHMWQSYFSSFKLTSFALLLPFRIHATALIACACSFIEFRQFPGIGKNYQKINLCNWSLLQYWVNMIERRWKLKILEDEYLWNPINKPCYHSFPIEYCRKRGENFHNYASSEHFKKYRAYKFLFS